MIEEMNISRMALNDLDRVNSILNDPSIYPFIHGNFNGKIDAKVVLENQIHYVFGHEYGTVMFIQLVPGFYEFHTCVLPNGRGSWTQQAGKACFEYMFTRTDAFELITRCPIGNKFAIAATKKSGLQKEFTTRPFWPVNDVFESMDVYTISLPYWTNNISDVENYGEWLHERYEEEFKRLGMDVKPHEHDGIHNKYAGATVLMLKYGQTEKAISFYNRYAILAGYDPVKIVSLDPVILECAGVKVKLNVNDFEVLSCQHS